MAHPPNSLMVSLAALLLLHQLVQELMSQRLVRHLMAHLGSLLAVRGRDREDFAVDRVSPRVRPAIDLDVNRVARRHPSPSWHDLRASVPGLPRPALRPVSGPG